MKKHLILSTLVLALGSTTVKPSFVPAWVSKDNAKWAAQEACGFGLGFVDGFATTALPAAITHLGLSRTSIGSPFGEASSSRMLANYFVIGLGATGFAITRRLVGLKNVGSDASHCAGLAIGSGFVIKSFLNALSNRSFDSWSVSTGAISNTWPKIIRSTAN